MRLHYRTTAVACAAVLALGGAASAQTLTRYVKYEAGGRAAWTRWTIAAPGIRMAMAGG